MTRRATALLVAGLVTGCLSSNKDGSDATRNCPTGDETCACYPNRTCNGALTCLSNRCVDVGSQEDGGSKTTTSRDHDDASASSSPSPSPDASKPSRSEPSDPDGSEDPSTSDPAKPADSSPTPASVADGGTQPKPDTAVPQPAATNPAPDGTSDGPSPVGPNPAGPSGQPSVCTPGERRCETTLLSVCNEAGSAWDIAQCPLGQTCSGDQCALVVCEPSETYCGSATEVYSCSPDGREEYVAQDCALTGQVCFEGACREDCVPSQKLCRYNSVYICSEARFLDLISRCSSNAYCDPVAFECKLQVCEPGPTCDGNVATTCNELGSGFEPGGTACGTQTCVQGQCADPIFVDDFEDELVLWENTDVEDYSVGTVSPGADGTGVALGVSHRVSSVATFDGPYRVFPSNLLPEYISFWAKAIPGSVGTPRISFSSTTTGTGDVFAFTFAAGDRIQVVAWESGYSEYYDAPGALTSDQWYFVEFRHIDWNAGTFDWYLDGKLVLRDLRMSTTAGIRRIDVFGGAYGTMFTARLSIDDLSFY